MFQKIPTTNSSSDFVLFNFPEFEIKDILKFETTPKQTKQNENKTNNHTTKPPNETTQLFYFNTNRLLTLRLYCVPRR